MVGKIGAAMILTGDYVVTNAAAPPLKDGAIAISDGKVVAIGDLGEIKARHPDMPVRGGPGHAVIPGFIDSHQHGRGLTNIQRGVPDGPLEQWLIRLRGVWPAEPYLTTALAAVRLLRSGVTTAMHHHATSGALPFEAEVETSLQAYVDSRLRVTFTLDFRDTNYYVYAPDEKFLAGLSPELAASVRAQVPARELPKSFFVFGMLPGLREKYGSDRVLFALGPQSMERSTEKLIGEIVAFAKSENLPIHTHALETRWQRDASLKDYGITPIERLARLGLLTDKTSLAHMVWASSGDLDIVKATGAAIAHNPASNLRLRSGVAPVLAMLRAGIPVGLGMDSMSLSDRSDYFEDLRLCRNLHFDDGKALDDDQLWRMLYEGGRAATFWGDSIGQLGVGSWADAVLFRLAADGRVKPVDPQWRVMDRVLREGSPESIAAVIVGGEVVVEDGKCLTIDEASVLERIARAAEAVDSSALADRREIIAALAAEVGNYLYKNFR